MTSAVGVSMSSRRVDISVTGLLCAGGAALSLERSLKRRGGVVDAYVNPATSIAYVSYDDQKVSATELAAIVREHGFGATIGRES